MKTRSKWLLSALGLCLVLAGAGGFLVYRVQRAWSVAWDLKDHIRYQLESGQDIAETPMGEAVAVDYLERIFEGSPELLDKLKGVVQRGLEDTPALRLGEVSAMVVTYRQDEEGEATDVVAHVLGGFPLGKRKPGFHRDGYFRHLIDRDLWNLGNAVISLMGRDMIMFAEEHIAEQHQEMLESIFVLGDVYPLVEYIEKAPVYFTAVFPDPRRLVPIQLRHHVQALVFKGHLAPKGGRMELVALTPSARSASYALSIISDMKMFSEVALRTKWKGVPIRAPWGTYVETWWAHAMVETSRKTALEKQHNILRIRTEFDRVMANAVVKSVERMGRDLAQMRGSLEERLDPRLVDERLFSAKPQHYWSDSHRWGPNWPFRGETNEFDTADAAPSAGPNESAPSTPADRTDPSATEEL